MAIVGSDTLVLRFQSDGDGRVVASLGNVEGGLSRVEARAGGAALGMGRLGAAALALPITTMVAFGTAAVAQMDTMRARLVTFTGSAAAAEQVLQRMRPLSRELGQDVLSLSDAYIKLTNLGLKPTDAMLRSFANTAAAQGKSLKMFAEAVADAATGEFERLKEFGIKARQEGESVVFTFQGVETKLAKNAAAITGYLERIGNSEYAGAAARQAETLSGEWDKLTNSAGRLAVAVGDSGLGEALKETTGWIGEVTEATAVLIEKVNALRNARGSGGGAFENGLRFTGPGNMVGTAMDVVGGLQQMQADRERIDLLGRMSEAYGEVRGAIDGIVQAGLAEHEKNESVSKSIAQVIERLDEEAATLGKTRSAVLEYQKAKALSKDVTDAERAALTASYDAMIAAARAQEASTKATKDSAKADKDAAAAKRDKAQRDKEVAAALKAATDAEDRFTEGVYRLIGSLLPGGDAARKFAEAIVTLDLALAEGVISPERYEQAIAALQNSEVEAILKDIGKDHGDIYADAFLSGTERLSVGFADAIGAAIFKDGDIAEALAAAYRDFAQTQIDAAVEGLFGGPMNRRNGGDSAAGQSGVPSLDYAPVTPVGQPGAGGATASGGNGMAGAIANVAAAYGVALVGGSGKGAQTGAAIGAAIGSYWGPIGSAIGAVLGGWVGGMFDEDPSVRVSSRGFGQAEGRARSSFGDIFVRTESVTNPTSDDIAQSVADFDNILASLFSPEEVARVRAAVRNLNEVGGSLEDVLQARFTAIIRAVEPQWVAFLNSFGDVEERVRQFSALRNLKDMIGELDDTIASLAGDPMVALEQQLEKWQEGIEETAQALEMAADAQDPALFEAAAERHAEAIRTWATEAIAAAEGLEAALFDLQRQRRQFEIGLAQRIASLGGAGFGNVIGLLAGDVGELRTRVQSGRSPEQSLQYLNEFIDTVDQWLQQSTAEINRQLAMLDAERDEILGRGAARAAAAQAFWQMAAQAQQAALDAQRQALQEQLRIAQEWLGVLQQADQFLEQMTFTSANPLGAQLRLELLNQQVDALFAQFRSTTGSAQAGIAGQLLQLLQQQLGLNQELFQRPSDEGIAAYNEILRDLAEVRGVAQPEADRVRELQEQLNALQAETVAAVNVQTDAMFYLSAEERERLDEIEEERAEWQAKQEEVNAQAREWYEWAQTEGRRLQEEQHQILTDQLALLTGGLPVDQFIAGVHVQARDYLRNISENIRTFLAAIGLVGSGISSGGAGTGPIAGPGVILPIVPIPLDPPGTPGRSTAAPALNLTMNINAPNVTGDRASFINMAVETAPQLASIFKRELDLA